MRRTAAKEWIYLATAARLLDVQTGLAAKILAAGNVRMQTLPASRPRYHAGDVARLISESVSVTPTTSRAGPPRGLACSA